MNELAQSHPIQWLRGGMTAALLPRWGEGPQVGGCGPCPQPEHLEGAEEHLKAELGEAQVAPDLFLGHRSEHRLVDAQQRHQRQRGASQPGRRGRLWSGGPGPHLASGPLPSFPRPPPPQPVVQAPHLPGPQLGHEDAKDSDKDEEINLRGKDRG